MPSPLGGRRPRPVRPDLRAALGQARGWLLPAGRAGLAGLAAVALVAGAFLAGRVTRSAQAAPAATTTTRAFDPEGDQQVYNWPSRTVDGIQLSLTSIDAGDRVTTVTLEASGVPDARSIATLRGLSITDADSHQLLRSAPIPEAPARGRALNGQQTAQITVEEPLTDKAAVDQVQVDSVTLASQLEEDLAVTVVDPRLRHLPLHETDPCRGCKLDAHCTSCSTMTVAGASYHQGEVVLLLAPKGPLDRSVLSGGDPDVVISNIGAGGGEVQPAVDRGPGGVTAVQFAMNDLALGSTEPRVQLQVTVVNELQQTANGPWRMRRR
ncbi:MAG TPA: hypothetical protein VF486_22330 [Actinomycetes bacterium]